MCETFITEIKQNKEGRYEVKLPFKADHPVLPDNFNLFEKHLESKLKALKQNPKLLKEYDQVFREQKQLGITEEANEKLIVGLKC